MPPFATTKHLNLRALHESDKTPWLAQENDWRVARTAHPAFVVPLGDSAWKKIEEGLREVLLLVIIEVKKEYAHLRKWDADELRKPDEEKTQEDWDRELWAGFAVLAFRMPKNRDAEFGLNINAQWWGNGFGTEVTEWVMGHAFEQLNVHRVSLAMFANNPAARRVYQKCGFVVEGQTRKAFWLDGEWVDEVHMGLLDEEY